MRIAVAALLLVLAVGAPASALAAGGHAAAGGHPGAVPGSAHHFSGHFEGRHFVGHRFVHRGLHGGVFVAPVIPFYGYYWPPVYDSPAPAYWYYCPSYRAYYPNVATCPDNWVPVPAS